MTRPDMRTAIEKGVFLLDGAMGTQLIARGVEPGVCNDAINIESPEIIADIHRAYLKAGSDAIVTNTFGANRYALARHGCAEKAYEISRAGAELARKAAGPERYVLGDIGPTGDFLEPLGTLKAGDAQEAFAEQARGLLDGGVDGFIVETMTALEELEVAVRAVKSLDSGLPVFASMSFDKTASDYRTMMGVEVSVAVAKMIELGADAVGFNCGTATLEEYVALAAKYVSAVRSAGADVTVFAEPNAGKPELEDGEAVYKVTCDEFAAAAKQIHAAGVHVLGGCCGTAPAFIAALADALK